MVRRFGMKNKWGMNMEVGESYEIDRARMKYLHPHFLIPLNLQRWTGLVILDNACELLDWSALMYEWDNKVVKWY
jgi:hypothetical protein